MATAAARYPPGPKARYPLAHLLGFRRDPLGFLLRNAQIYGDVVHWRVGPQHSFMLNDPDLIRQVLVTDANKFIKGRVLERSKRVLGEGLLTSEHEYHLRQRRLAAPAFHRQRVTAYGEAMVEQASRMADRWEDGQHFDVHQEMMRLTLGIVGKTLFDADVESDAREIAEALITFMEMFSFIFLPFSEYLEKLPIPQVKRLQRARQRLDNIVYRLIRERRARGDAGQRTDLLSMLLSAQDTDGGGGGMTDEQLRDECVTIILAGHETTANALTFTWYLLAQNPECDQRLSLELREVLGGRLPAIEDLPRLPYTEMVFAESMRLFPPAWGIARRTNAPYNIRGCDVPPKSLVVMSQWVMHRDARFFPDPTRFDPQRWTPEAKATRPKFSYFPFGAGPRQCIGEAFAWMEGVLLIATIAQRFRMQLEPGFKLELQPVITLRPRHGVPMSITRRT